MGCFDSSSTTAANPSAQAAYDDVVSKAQAVSATPYQPYTGQLIAPMNDGQNTAVNRLQGAYGTAQPYIRQGFGYMQQAAQGLGSVQNYLQASSEAAAGVQPYQAAAGNEFGQANTLIGQASAGLGGVGRYQDLAQGAYGQAQGYQGQAAGAYGQMQAGLGQVGQYLKKADGYFGQAAGLATPQDFNGADGVSKYMNPFTQSVIDQTMRTAHQNDAIQTAGIVGNAIGSGAYGGDRNGIAVATLAGQQAMANDATIAGLNKDNYAQATAQFNTTQAQRQQGAGILSGLGSGALQAGGLQLNTSLGYGQAGQGLAGLSTAANATGAGYTGLGQLQGQTAQEYGNLASTSTGIGSGYNATGQLGLGVAGQYGQLGTLQGQTGQAYAGLGTSTAALGTAAQGNLISGASAGLQGATLQQQSAQQQDTADYNQYMAGLSYPFQNISFLSNIVQGIGSQEGSTATNQGSALSGITGLTTAGVGIAGATGAFGANGYFNNALSSAAPLTFAHGGAVSAPKAGGFGAMMQAGPAAPEPVLGLGDVGRVAAAQGLGLAARMSKAAGGPVMGFGTPAPTVPPGGLGTPFMAGVPQGFGLAARPRFLDGGAVDNGTAPLPAGGLNVSPLALTNASGLNVSPAGLVSGGAMAHAPQPSLGSVRSNLATPGPTSTLATGQPAPSQGLGAVSMFGSGAGGGSGTGLGTPVSFSSDGKPGTGAVTFSGDGQAQGSGPAPAGESSGSGLNQNAWMSVLAAGLGMMGGRSGSGLANIGEGGLEGLKMYTGLQQQDRQNAMQQNELALRQKTADQTADYQNKTLGLDQMKVDLSVKQLELAVQQAQREAGIQSATLANATRNTDSEIATRDQTAQMNRYQQTYVPGVGMVVRDMTKPYEAPRTVPFAGQSADAVAAPPSQPAASPPSQAGPPPAMPTPTPQPAPPPQGGVSAPGAALSAPATPASGTGADWTPTTAVPKGYVPPNQASIYMNPGVLKGEQDNATKMIEEARGQAAAGSQLQMRLDEMDRQYAQLPKTGVLAPGAAATARADLAKGINAFATSIGAQAPYDPNEVAANENLVKDRFRLGADLAKQMGGREPGYIVEQAVKANPGADNTPLAYQRITAGLRQASQYQQDRAAFFDDYNAQFGHLNGAQRAFDRLNPPERYADRAVISTVDPRDVGALRQNAKNPAAAAAIDQKYGVGTSAIIMRQ